MRPLNLSLGIAPVHANKLLAIGIPSLIGDTCLVTERECERCGRPQSRVCRIKITPGVAFANARREVSEDASNITLSSQHERQHPYRVLSRVAKVSYELSVLSNQTRARASYRPFSPLKRWDTLIAEGPGRALALPNGF